MQPATANPSCTSHTVQIHKKGKAIAHLGDLELLLTRIFLQLHLHPTSFFSNSGELLRRV
jgi:hypothetical protein